MLGEGAGVIWPLDDALERRRLKAMGYDGSRCVSRL